MKGRAIADNKRSKPVQDASEATADRASSDSNLFPYGGGNEAHCSVYLPIATAPGILNVNGDWDCLGDWDSGLSLLESIVLITECPATVL